MHYSIGLLLRLFCICVSKLEASFRSSFHRGQLPCLYGYRPLSNVGPVLHQKLEISITGLHDCKLFAICWTWPYFCLFIARFTLFLGTKSLCFLVSELNCDQKKIDLKSEIEHYFKMRFSRKKLSDVVLAMI